MIEDCWQIFPCKTKLCLNSYKLLLWEAPGPLDRQPVSQLDHRVASPPLQLHPFISSSSEFMAPKSPVSQTDFNQSPAICVTYLKGNIVDIDVLEHSPDFPVHLQSCPEGVPYFLYGHVWPKALPEKVTDYSTIHLTPECPSEIH